jgi:peptidyl-prolyl cis-trans isomerase A (cyclophilin A)
MLVRIVLILLSVSLAAAAQTASPTALPQTKKTPAKAAASPATSAKPLQAILHTTAGDMKCELFPDKAPKAVANFIGLATGKKDWTNPSTGQKVHGKPLYDGVIFHRVIPNFMIQSGDPMGTGYGNPGYTFADELDADLLFDRPGRLAMANSGPNTNGSQFFITEVPYPSLNPCLDEGGCVRGNRTAPKNSGYTLFGQCDASAVELVKRIARGNCQGGVPCDFQNSKLLDPVKITHIEILNAPGTAPKPAVAKPSAAKPGGKTSAAKPAASAKPSPTPQQ